MDTAKAANLYVDQRLVSWLALTYPLPRFTVYKDSDLFDFINAPVGKGLPIAKTLRPLIAGETIVVLITVFAELTRF